MKKYLLIALAALSLPLAAMAHPWGPGHFNHRGAPEVVVPGGCPNNNCGEYRYHRRGCDQYRPGCRGYQGQRHHEFHPGCPLNERQGYRSDYQRGHHHDRMYSQR